MISSPSSTLLPRYRPRDPRQCQVAKSASEEAQRDRERVGRLRARARATRSATPIATRRSRARICLAQTYPSSAAATHNPNQTVRLASRRSTLSVQERASMPNVSTAATVMTALIPATWVQTPGGAIANVMRIWGADAKASHESGVGNGWRIDGLTQALSRQRRLVRFRRVKPRRRLAPGRRTGADESGVIRSGGVPGAVSSTSRSTSEPFAAVTTWNSCFARMSQISSTIAGRRPQAPGACRTRRAPPRIAEQRSADLRPADEPEPGRPASSQPATSTAGIGWAM